MEDTTKLKGKVTVTLRKANGEIDTEVIDNLVVDLGKSHVASLLTASPETPMVAMALGDPPEPVDPPAAWNTELQQELSRHDFTSVTRQPGSPTVVYRADWGAIPGPDGAVGVLTEAGLFNSSNSGGIMLSRVTFKGKNKGELDSITVEWAITAA